ncbi:MAG: CotH kinase family protein [Candidatus Sumerlaeia bacterium]|nr:CotH kinase family protein [Candidatus Sumerlaeia bacterium]
MKPSKSNLISPATNKFAHLLLLASLSATVSFAYGHPVINEFVASNGSTLADEDGDQPDWIELYNPGEETFSLEGWFLSDDEDDPLMWAFPAVSLEPGAFLVVFASGKDRTEGIYLHTNFAISSSGEPLLLSNPEGDLIDFVEPVELPRDVSYGRQPDGGETWGFFENPTPGAANLTNQYEGILPIPELSHKGGFHASPFSTNIINEQQGVEYRISFDGSEPTMDSLLYTDPIQITTREGDPNQYSMIRTMAPHLETRLPETEVQKATTLRVRGFREGWLPSPTLTRTFLVTEEMENRYHLPVISLVSDPDGLFSDETGILVPGDLYDPEATNSANNNFTGNYMRRGHAWERPVHLEFWETDGTEGFNINAGVRVHGGAGRMFERKSLRLYFRGDYGQSTLNYPMFEEGKIDEFDRLILRGGSQDRFRALMRDEFASEMARNLNIERMRWRPLNLFLNGEYWGIKYFRDRLDHHYLARLHELDPGNLDGIDRNGTVTMGTRQYWNNFNSILGTLNPEEPSDFVEISRWMDMDSYIDYLAINMFMANLDWPVNNVEYWRHRTETLPPPNSTPTPSDGRWRWLLIDQDISSGFMTNHHLDPTMERITGTGGWESRIIDALIDFPEFRSRLANRMLDLLNSDFHPINTMATMERMRSLIAPEMPENDLRWPRLSWAQSWETNMTRLSNFLNNRPSFLVGHLNEFFELDGEAQMTFAVHPPRTGKIAINSWQPEHHEFPVSGTYLSGLPIRLVPEPAPGYRFMEWQGNIPDLPDEQTGEVNPQHNTTITANFAPDPNYNWNNLGWPSPAILSEGVYTLDLFDPETQAGTYPDHTIFLQTDHQDPMLNDPLTEPYTIAYNLESRSRIAGLDGLGIGMINTSNPQEDGGGYLGGVVLALNTMDTKRVEVSFEAGTVLPNSRPYAIRLRGRSGIDGEWFDLQDNNGDAVEYVRNANAGHTQHFGPIDLPDELINEPYIQLKWRYHALETTESGPRAFLRINDIAVKAHQNPIGWMLY